MRAVIQPFKKQYRILFFDNHHIRATGFVELSATPKGARPFHYRLRQGKSPNYRNIPSRDLVTHLRRAIVKLTAKDPELESFLTDLQIQYSYIQICRFCLMDDLVTEIDRKDAILFGEDELICVDCARKELRRELAHMGRLGRSALTHLDELILRYRSVDKVLATIDPSQLSIGHTLYDRLVAHPVVHTSKIDELPLPRQFIDASGVVNLMPVQQLAVEAGLLFGKDLLVVSATASGKTFIGELAGLKNILEKRGRFIFLVPLVALAYQKYERFVAKYGKFVDVAIVTGASRIILGESRRGVNRSTAADIIIATYEGIDHMMRIGKRLPNIGTVVVDEVQMLEDKERGHRVDGLIARLKYTAPKAQFLYLSATIGHPKLLAKKLSCQLVRYDDRPVTLERYLIFLERKQKIPTEKALVMEEYTHVSDKGFHGQSIIFSNSRVRCHQVAEKLGEGVAPYHAGLTQEERRSIEDQFAKGQLKAVVTTAALAAGVDFPASQVIFDSLAMGIEWLTVQEFHQMSGRAGRPDFHDLGKVVILAEPGGAYIRGSKLKEEEVAMGLLKGEMGEVAPVYALEQSSEVFVANVVISDGDRKDLTDIESSMVGEMEQVEDLLMQRGLIYQEAGKICLTPLARVMAEHFIGVERLSRVCGLVKEIKDPLDILAELDCATDEEASKDWDRHIKKSEGQRGVDKRRGKKKKPVNINK